MKEYFKKFIIIILCGNMGIIDAQYFPDIQASNEIDKVKSDDGVDNLINAIICNGDTNAYNNIIKKVPYYDYFVYSLYMANEFDYPSAYYRAYRIYDLWNKMYGCIIDSISWHNLKFWVEWGAEAKDGACKIILRDSIMTSEQTLATLDSIDGFVFVLPDLEPFEDSLHVSLSGGYIKFSISTDDFMNYKKQLVCFGDTTSIGVLERYQRTKVFSTNELLLFRVCDQIKYRSKKNIVFCVLWYLAQIYRSCPLNKSERFEKAFNSKIGIKILIEGYRAGDKFSIIPLAKLYAQGVYLQKDTTLALSLLKQKMSEEAARRWVHKWTEE